MQVPSPQGALAPFGSTEGSYVTKWRRTLLVAIPFGALAYLVGWILEKPSGQVTAFDMISYPIMAVVMIALEGVLAVRRRSLSFVVMAIITGASAFFLCKLIWLLFYEPSTVDVQAQMTETFFWIPIIYLLSFILPWVRVGKYVAVVFSCSVLAVSLGFAVPRGIAGTEWNVIYALIELNLANTVLLALTSAFISFKEAYVRTEARMEVAERFAFTDSLTELPNRPNLQGELDARLERARMRNTQVAVLFIDVDGFKVINDTLGHDTGDELLRQFAERLKGIVRNRDFLARISGDEFVLVLEDIEHVDTASFVAQKLQASLVTPFYVSNQQYSVTASIGISIYPDDAADSDTLLRHADTAMYRVKRSGKNGVQRYRDESDAHRERQRALERELRSALQNEQIALQYQPLHELASGRVRKVEALVRWHHPAFGHVPPAEFIPIAEQSGMIVSLGEWILEEACRQAKAWQHLTGEGVKVAVNVSPMQFSQPSFYGAVVHALEKNGLMPEFLELELTEGIVMHGVDHVTSTLGRLQRLGVSIAIDDFGTGYSSLAYLRDLPIDSVKIDRSFVRDLDSPLRGPQFALALIEAIARLAQHLDLEVVAEGIETESQRRLLQDLGCQLGQGYLFAKPMPPNELQPYLHRPSSVRRYEADSFVN